MPQTKSAKKSLRLSIRRREINNRWRKKVSTALHHVHDAISANDKKLAQQAYLKAQRALDRAARHNVIHPNQAARKKSRLQRTIAKIN